MQATCSADGAVRVYEAMDVMNLALWNMMVRQAPVAREGNDDRRAVSTKGALA